MILGYWDPSGAHAAFRNRKKAGTVTKPNSPPEVDRVWRIWGSYYNIPKAIFYLLKGTICCSCGLRKGQRWASQKAGSFEQRSSSPDNLIGITGRAVPSDTMIPSISHAQTPTLNPIQLS